MRFSDNVQSFLMGPYLSGQAKEYNMNLRHSGVHAHFTINFEDFTIDFGGAGSAGVASSWNPAPSFASGAG